MKKSNKDSVTDADKSFEGAVETAAIPGVQTIDKSLNDFIFKVGFSAILPPYLFE